MIIRYLISFIAGTAITSGLFFAMQALIASGENPITDNVVDLKVEIADVQKEQDVQQKIRKPDKPDQAETPPETPDIEMDTSLNNVNTGFEIGGAKVDTSVAISGGGGFGSGDSEYLPIVQVPPQYPRRAAERGIEGYVVVEFTVTTLGTVKDVIVVESTSSIFERNAIKAALKYKYKPKLVDGEPVEVAGVLQKITFELEK